MPDLEVAETPTTSPLGVLAGLTSQRPESKIRKGLAVIAAAQIAHKGYKSLRGVIEPRFTYSFTIQGDDDLYPLALVEILKLAPDHKRRDVVASTRSRYSDSVGPGVSEATPLTLGFGGSTLAVNIGGYKVSVYSEANETIVGERALLRSKITLSTSAGPSGRDAIEAWLADLARRATTVERRPQLFIANRWGGWDRRNDLPARSMDTVVLPEDHADLILEDLGSFLDAESTYATLGVPWHRGYLFSGVPGSGKSSLARALANHFKMDVYYMPLADMADDADLLQLVSAVGPRSVLLLEDVDTTHIATDREQSAGNASLSGLLNALDGVTTPHGLVVIMTTNNRDALDSALIRPGRVDAECVFGYLTQSQLDKLWVMAYGEPTQAPRLMLPTLSAADVIGAIKVNIGDPEGALRVMVGQAG